MLVRLAACISMIAQFGAVLYWVLFCVHSSAMPSLWGKPVRTYVDQVQLDKPECILQAA